MYLLQEMIKTEFVNGVANTGQNNPDGCASVRHQKQSKFCFAGNQPRILLDHPVYSDANVLLVLWRRTHVHHSDLPKIRVHDRRCEKTVRWKAWCVLPKSTIHAHDPEHGMTKRFFEVPVHIDPILESAILVTNPLADTVGTCTHIFVSCCATLTKIISWIRQEHGCTSIELLEFAGPWRT